MNKTLTDYKIAKFINFLLNNRKNLLFFFNLLNILICIIIRDIEFFLILEIIILILTFSTKRVSKLLVYNSLFHIASMNLENVNMFKIYNYETEKWSNEFTIPTNNFTLNQNGVFTLNGFLIHANGSSGGFPVGKRYAIKVIIKDGRGL